MGSSHSSSLLPPDLRDSSMTVLCRELLSESELPNHPEAMRIDRAIRKLRDEVTGVAMARHNGHDRSLAFCMAKLDEASHWAIRYLEESGQVHVIDRAEILKRVTSETAETVDSEPASV